MNNFDSNCLRIFNGSLRVDCLQSVRLQPPENEILAAFLARRWAVPIATTRMIAAVKWGQCANIDKMTINPHFPALRSVPLALSGASRRKQTPSSQPRFPVATRSVRAWR